MSEAGITPLEYVITKTPTTKARLNGLVMGKYNEILKEQGVHHRSAADHELRSTAYAEAQEWVACTFYGDWPVAEVVARMKHILAGTGSRRTRKTKTVRGGGKSHTTTVPMVFKSDIDPFLEQEIVEALIQKYSWMKVGDVAVQTWSTDRESNRAARLMDKVAETLHWGGYRAMSKSVTLFVKRIS